MEVRIASALKELEQKGHLSTKQRLFLAPSFTSAPQIYGLLKVHKEGTPLRPIVSAIGSSTHQLVRELVRILKPLSGTTDSYMKDSSVFVERISQTTILESDVLVSFDVVSLFTRVPVDEALDVISELLLQDETLCLRAVFQVNGYPTRVVDRSLKKHPKPFLPEAQDQPTLHLPYVEGVSERIE